MSTLSMERIIMTDRPEMTDQTPKPSSSEPQPDLKPTTKGVFIRRAPGMPIEEFKKVCIKLFKERGLIR
jgi:hypothetical protein